MNRRAAVVPLVGDDFLNHLHSVIGHGGHGLKPLRRFRQRLLDRCRIALVGALYRGADDCARLEINRVLGLVCQVRSAVLHFRDLRVGIVRMFPLIVRSLFLALSIDPRQICACWRPNARRLGKLRQELLVVLARVASDDAAQRGIGF